MKLALTLAAALVAGCSTTGTSVPIGEQRFSPTAADDIVLLVAPPEREHTIIALVEGEAATDDYLSKARTEAAALQAMRTEAARLGAHAIVLTGKGTRPYGQVGIATTTGGATAIAPGAISGYSTTVTTGVGWEKITFSGTAIRYVGAPEN